MITEFVLYDESELAIYCSEYLRFQREDKLHVRSSATLGHDDDVYCKNEIKAATTSSESSSYHRTKLVHPIPPPCHARSDPAQKAVLVVIGWTEQGRAQHQHLHVLTLRSNRVSAPPRCHNGVSPAEMLLLPLPPPPLPPALVATWLAVVMVNVDLLRRNTPSEHVPVAGEHKHLFDDVDAAADHHRTDEFRANEVLSSTVNLNAFINLRRYP